MTETWSADNASFGELVRRRRERQGLSQAALARAIGSDSGYVNRMEQGQRTPTARGVVLEIVHALDCSTDETDRLLVAAGHLPVALAEIDLLDPDLLLAARLLGTGSTPTARAVARDVIRACRPLAELPRSLPGQP